MKRADCSHMRAVPQSKGSHLKMTKLKEEFFKILPPTVYFFVALHLVMFIRVLRLEGTGLSPFSSASIAFAALILGKAVLIADMRPKSNCPRNSRPADILRTNARAALSANKHEK